MEGYDLPRGQGSTAEHGAACQELHRKTEAAETAPPSDPSLSRSFYGLITLCTRAEAMLARVKGCVRNPNRVEPAASVPSLAAASQQVAWVPNERKQELHLAFHAFHTNTSRVAKVAEEYTAQRRAAIAHKKTKKKEQNAKCKGEMRLHMRRAKKKEQYAAIDEAAAECKKKKNKKKKEKKKKKTTTTKQQQQQQNTALDKDAAESDALQSPMRFEAFQTLQLLGKVVQKDAIQCTAQSVSDLLFVTFMLGSKGRLQDGAQRTAKPVSVLLFVTFMLGSKGRLQDGAFRRETRQVCLFLILRALY